MMFLDTLVKTQLASAAGWTLIHSLWERAILDDAQKEPA
jgi:hypothetical protein